MADGKYYWLKLKRDFFKRHDIRIIESMPNGKDYILFYLKLLCESVDHEGNLRFSEQIPYNEDMLSTITNTNIDIVRSAIKIFTELNMMDLMDDGTFYMNEVSKMIGSAADNDNANRQRRFREKQKTLALQNVTDSVTKCNDALRNVTECVTNNNESKSKNKSKSIDIEKEKEKRRRFVPPTIHEVNDYCRERKNNINAEAFIDYYESNGWMVGRNKMKDWKACVRSWEKKDFNRKKESQKSFPQRDYDYDELERRLINGRH